MGYITLREYLTRTGETQESIARRLGVSQSAVSQWLEGKTLPSLKMALQIEALTGVPCRAWAGELTDRRSGADRRLGGRRRQNRASQPDRRKDGRR